MGRNTSTAHHRAIVLSLFRGFQGLLGGLEGQGGIRSQAYPRMRNSILEHHQDQSVELHHEMAAPAPSPKIRMNSLSKDDISLHEVVVEDPTREYLQEYPLLGGKTPEALEQIEKSLKRRLDYIFLPMVTMVLFMG